jgi:hypothetical protein
MIYLVWSGRLDNAPQASRISKISVMQEEPHIRLVAILVQVVNTVRIETRGTPNDPMNYVSLSKKELGKVGTVLASNPGNQRSLHYPLVSL